MTRLLVEDPETNPRRRRRHRRHRRRARRMSAAQRAYFGGGRRRSHRRRSRRGPTTVVVRSNPRRRSGRRRHYRRNPRFLGLNLGGGSGLMGDLVRGGKLFAGKFLGDFAEAVIARRIPGMAIGGSPMKEGAIRGVIAIVGGFLLRKLRFTRGLAQPFTDANLLMAFDLMAPSSFHGEQVAMATGLGDYVIGNATVNRQLGAYVTNVAPRIPATVPNYR